MSLFGGKSNSQFDSLLNKATSNLNLETDWAAILNICDLIRQQDVNAKYAVSAVRKKLCHDNPHTVFYALQTVEAMVKNCGNPVYDEVLTVEFLDLLKELSKSQDPVKEKVLELIQIWASVFSNQSRYRCIQDVFSSLKREGHSFPAVRSSDAMFEAEAAPEWKEGSLCHKCRAQFTTFRRKHHCRSCGNIFCDECSDKRSIIPRFGIEKEVRVCKACYDEINRSSSADSNRYDDRSEAEAKMNKDKERELELREKEELELALALSASEAESKTNQRSKPRQQQAAASGSPSAAPAGSGGGLYSKLDTSGMDPELVVYLDRNYWEKRRRDGQQQEAQASAGVSKATTATAGTAATAAAASFTVASSQEQSAVQKGGQTNGESAGLGKDEDAGPREEFLRALASSIEIFVNRMKADSVRGRSVAADGTVQTLFMTLNQMHPQLIEHMNRVEARRNILEEQQDKLARLRDAREALNALRDEHEQRRKAEQQERDKQRFAQMMIKLEEMRQKKHEFMEYQRQLQIQQMEAQRREFEMRMEAQKQRQAMEQYKQQFPYSSGAYQQQLVPQPGQPGPQPPASSGGYAIQYPPGYPVQQQQPPPQSVASSAGYSLPHSAAPTDPSAQYMYHMQQQPPSSDAQYSTAPMSLPPQHHPQQQQQYSQHQPQQQQPSYTYAEQYQQPQQQPQQYQQPQVTSSDPQQQQQQQQQSDEAQLIQF
ncbi:hypothetical protein BOX15_Mlig029941g1 [Macrostomum lignano]|uniref:Hepatocyte growth factor-regulated tyrosine kinase substrate n=1 Tax=Macrostomum lignano TaxID=282301 RepID=A0A267H2D0_9PLAT|nr:hypothetical protein BOX15_Mlig029941g1 [Macrostomum lignano]